MSFQIAKRSMLVVDDDEGILRVFRRIFERIGYSVTTAKTGKEAKAKLERGVYDVTLVDLRLPDINGAILVQEMKKKAPGMLKIVITGMPDELAPDVLEKGADAFVEKPVQPQFLIKLLDEKLKKRTWTNSQILTERQ